MRHRHTKMCPIIKQWLDYRTNKIQMAQIWKSTGKYKLKPRMGTKAVSLIIKHGKQVERRILISLIKLKVPPLNKLDAEIYIYIYTIPTTSWIINIQCDGYVTCMCFRGSSFGDNICFNFRCLNEFIIVMWKLCCEYIISW